MEEKTFKYLPPLIKSRATCLSIEGGPRLNNRNLLKVLAAVALVVIFVIPYATVIQSNAQATKGQPVTQITFIARTSQQTAILQVASGQADVFLWSMPLGYFKTLSPSVSSKLKLIKTLTTYFSLAINPANNVYDPTAPGTIVLQNQNITGQAIPGLMFWNPSTITSGQKLPNPNWVPITLIKEKNAWKNLHFNPFALQEIRFALNFLINRQFIVSTILGGSAYPAYGPVMPNNPVALQKLGSVYTQLGLTATGNVKKSEQMFLNAMKKANETLVKYHMYVKLVNGKWYFFKPDGSSEPIKVYFLIRIEDERYQIGLQISSWLEKYWNLTVVKIPRTRAVVTPVVYEKNLVQTSPSLGDIVWSLYTEGWVSMSEEPPSWARYDVAFFLCPMRGYGPNGGITSWWYWYQPKLNKLGIDLYFGSFTQQNVSKLWNETKEALLLGEEAAPRVFLTLDIEYFPVNAQRVVSLVPGVVSGLWTPWALRTLQTPDGKATVIEYSSTGALFMSPWNPVLGFTDVYSMTMGQLVFDFGVYPSPSTGQILPIRVANYTVQYGSFTGGYVFNASEWKWVPMKGTAPVKVTVKFYMGKWHDGTPMTMADFLYWYAFYWKWTHKNNKTDPYYDPEIAENMAYVMSLIKGIKVVGPDTLVIYTNYLDVTPGLILYNILIYPTMPWYEMSAAEYMIVHHWKYKGSGLPYGWVDREGRMSGINFIKPDMAQDVKKALEILKSENFIPPYISTYPGYQNYLSYSIGQAYQNAINFIDTYGHAFISNGPYYIVSYNPTTHKMVLKWFKDYPFKPGYWNTKLEVWAIGVTNLKAPSVVVAGTPLQITFNTKLYRLAPSYFETTPSSISVIAILETPVKNATTGKVTYKEIARIPSDYIKYSAGTATITLPSSFTAEYLKKPGTYVIALFVSSSKSATVYTASVILTSLGMITTTTSTTTSSTTTSTTSSTTTSTTTTSTTTPTSTSTTRRTAIIAAVVIIIAIIIAVSVWLLRRG